MADELAEVTANRQLRKLVRAECSTSVLGSALNVIRRDCNGLVCSKGVSRRGPSGLAGYVMGLTAPLGSGFPRCVAHYPAECVGRCSTVWRYWKASPQGLASNHPSVLLREVYPSGC